MRRTFWNVRYCRAIFLTFQSCEKSDTHITSINPDINMSQLRRRMPFTSPIRSASEPRIQMYSGHPTKVMRTPLTQF